jgi:hypothetical protein
MDELSGRTTGRLGDIRPDTARAIGGTAKLAYDTLSSPHSPPDPLSDNYGPAEGCWSMGNAAAPAGAVGPFTGLRAGRSSGRRRRRHRRRRTFQGLRAGRSRRWTLPEYIAARERLDHATFRKRADASVRCTEIGVTLYMPRFDEARAGYLLALM